MAFQTGVTDRLATEKPFNNLLRTLREQDYALIAPHLVAAQQAANELLYNPGDNVDMAAPADGMRVTQPDVTDKNNPRTSGKLALC